MLLVQKIRITPAVGRMRVIRAKRMEARKRIELPEIYTLRSRGQAASYKLISPALLLLAPSLAFGRREEDVLSYFPAGVPKRVKFSSLNGMSYVLRPSCNTAMSLPLSGIPFSASYV